MVSGLERKVREMDNAEKPVKESAREIANALGSNYKTIIMYLRPKRMGFGSQKEYVECIKVDK